MQRFLGKKRVSCQYLSCVLSTATKNQTLRNALVGILIRDDRILMKIENTGLSFSGSSSVYLDIYLGK